MSLPALFTYLLLLQSVLWFKVSLTLNLPPIQILGAQSPDNGIVLENSTSLKNTSSLVTGRPTFRCIGGAEYGDSIGFASCQNAASILLASTGAHHQQILTFRDRKFGEVVGKADVILPYLSLSYDGLCAFEITSTSYVVGHATSSQVRRAADDLLKTCKVGPNKVRGGTVTQLGQLGRLGLKLTKFDASNVVCRGLSQPLASECIPLVNKMPAIDRLERFGPRDEANVDVPLPSVIQADPDVNCRITVSSVGATDMESWYTIWKQAAAIERLCLENLRKPGFALNLGVNRHEIDVEITS